MVTTLRTAIRQRRPFPSLEAEAYLNIQRTADAFLRGLAEVLKAVDLSPTHYNVLRILRCAEPSGLSCGEVGERMVTRDPDITRLLDRMERRGLITRARERSDRRVVRTRITAEGLRLVGALDEVVPGLHRRQLGHLGERRLRTLIGLLETARREGS
jgi:DNA-binding MarR family transcriptional regulator